MEARVLNILDYIQTLTKRNNYWEDDWEGGVGAEFLKLVFRLDSTIVHLSRGDALKDCELEEKETT